MKTTLTNQQKAAKWQKMTAEEFAKALKLETVAKVVKAVKQCAN